MKRFYSEGIRSCFMVAFLFIALFAVGGTVYADDQAAPAAAEEEKPTASVGTDIFSQYLWRGYALSAHSAVIQPSFTAGYKGFSVNIWGNFDTDQNRSGDPSIKGARWNETDFTASYTRELCTNFNATAGTIYYSFVNSQFDAWEIFSGVSYTFPWVTVALTAYREVTHTPGWWVQLDFSKSIPLPWYGMSLALGATFGYQSLFDSDTLLNKNGKTGSYSSAHAGTISAALPIPVCKWVSIAPKIGVAFPLTSEASDVIAANSWDGDSTHVFGGINVTASF